MPLLSIIIPTHKRPTLLKRAIDSAQKLGAHGEIEILVIPNGNDQSWKAIAHENKKDKKIKWFYLEKGNASEARNHGINMSNGKYIRFLDDDDILLPESMRQLENIDTHGHEISLAPIEIQFNNKTSKIAHLPNSNDIFDIALKSIWGSFITAGGVFLKSSIASKKWRGDVTLYDDYIWFLSLAKEKEWDWIAHENPVMSYTQHFGDRLSATRRNLDNTTQAVNSIIDAYKHIICTRRSSDNRIQSAASALLTLAHSTFPANPIYLSKVILQAQRMYPSAAPLQPLFHNRLWLSKNLLTAEWLMLPSRYISRSYRKTSNHIQGIIQNSNALKSLKDQLK